MDPQLPPSKNDDDDIPFTTVTTSGGKQNPIDVKYSDYTKISEIGNQKTIKDKLEKLTSLSKDATWLTGDALKELNTKERKSLNMLNIDNSKTYAIYLKNDVFAFPMFIINKDGLTATALARVFKGNYIDSLPDNKLQDMAKFEFVEISDDFNDGQLPTGGRLSQKKKNNNFPKRTPMQKAPKKTTHSKMMKKGTNTVPVKQSAKMKTKPKRSLEGESDPDLESVSID